MGAGADQSVVATDGHLVATVDRATGGDEDAMRELVEACGPDLERFLRKRGLADPEGHVGELLADFIRRLPSLSFAHDRQVWAYLYRMGRSRLRVERHIVEAEPAFESNHVERGVDATNVEDLVLSQVLMQDLLGRLTDKQAEVLIRRFVQDASLEETAVAMDLTAPAVKSLQARGLKAARVIALGLVVVALAVGLVVLTRLAADPIQTGPVNEAPETTGTDADRPVSSATSEPDQPPTTMTQPARSAPAALAGAADATESQGGEAEGVSASTTVPAGPEGVQSSESAPTTTSTAIAGSAASMPLMTTTITAVADPAAGGGSLVVAHSGQCIDVAWLSMAAGANVQQYDCNGGENQRFQAVPVDSGFLLRAAHSGHCLEVLDSSLAAIANVVQGPCDSGDNQILSWAGPALVFKHSAMCLDVNDLSLELEANVQQYPCNGGLNQQFRFVGP